MEGLDFIVNYDLKYRLSRGGGEEDLSHAANFEWDEKKAKTNAAKHGVSFEDAATVFADPLSLTIPDPAHSQAEERFIILGESHSGK